MRTPSSLALAVDLSPAEITFHQQHKYVIQATWKLTWDGHISNDLRLNYSTAWYNGCLEEQGRWFAELWSAEQAGSIPVAVKHINLVAALNTK